MQCNAEPPIPLCDIQAQYRPLREELLAAAARVFDSGQVILGPEVAALEAEAAQFCGARYAVGCSSGSDALSLALAALDIGPGDEVIVPTFTFFATAGAVARCGATPVFADIDPVTYNIEPREIGRRATPRTKAVIPVHLFGLCADMGAIREAADTYALAVIEDAAQAFGAEYRDRRAGSFGAANAFSFYPSKNLAAYGDAGMVTTDDKELYGRLKTLRVHGMEPRYYHAAVGWNARIDPVHAAMLRVKLPHIGGWLDGRRAAAARYDALIADRGLDADLLRPTAPADCLHVYNQYVLKVAGGRRDGLLAGLKSRGVGCEVYYPLPLHLQECFSELGYRPGDFPASEKAAQEVIALPMFPEITPEQQTRVIDACADVLAGSARQAA